MQLYSLKKGLKRARKGANLTQQELAEKLGCHIKTIQNWEQGQAIPDLNTLFGLCELYCCDLDYLTGNIDCQSHDIQFIHEMTGLSEKSIAKLHEFLIAEDRRSRWSSYISSIIEHELFIQLMSRISEFMGSNFLEGAFEAINENDNKENELDFQDAMLFRISHIITNILEDIALEKYNKGISKMTKQGKEAR